jgi:hypothetical protein
VHGKLGQVCELDPGQASNKIGQQQKITIQTPSTKFRNIYLRNFAEFCEIIVVKFSEINFNFVLISYFAK